jgi:hypothetical protein
VRPDTKFTPSFDAVFTAAGIEIIRTPRLPPTAKDHAGGPGSSHRAPRRPSVPARAPNATTTMKPS